MIEQHRRRAAARARLTAAFERGVIEIGEKNWTRDDLMSAEVVAFELKRLASGLRKRVGEAFAEV